MHDPVHEPLSTNISPLYVVAYRRPLLRQETKGPNVGLSFYAFFDNKNDDPELLKEVATWWIMTNKFDHFEKAVKNISKACNLINDICALSEIGTSLQNIYTREMVLKLNKLFKIIT